MTNRRQFLERSMLGFGSAFLLPSLLASCTDHTIPPITPPIGGDDIDWNNDAKNVVANGLSLVPEVGTVLAAFTNVFWPNSGDDVWGQIKDQVEALINQKIADKTYQDVSDDLKGLNGLVGKYQEALQAFKANPLNESNITNIQNAFSNLDDAFINALPHFQSNGLAGDFRVPLLPLFAQFANLYLSLLRDGVLHGADWGRSSQLQSDTANELTHAISAFTTYAATTYNAGRGKIFFNTPDDRYNVEPFRSTNAYDRHMTQTVLDFMDTWKYYDVSKYPNGAKNPDNTPINLFTREIYSDPYGNIVNGAIPEPPGISLPSPATQFPIQIIVYAGNRIDAVQLLYPAGGGPGGVTLTPRMGDKNGGSTNAPHGGTVTVSPDLPISQASVTYGNTPEYVAGDPQLINTLQFNSINGNSNQLSNQFGGDPGKNQSGFVGYDGYALSSIYIHGTAVGYPDTSADCIVFGFLPIPRH